ncbi:MAG: alpha/beta fold hydrolase [Acidobacteriia bacterium]|nr:alpha/beta fold hydrolase [Terriglobia bacterium]
MGNGRIIRVGIAISLLASSLTGNAWSGRESDDKQGTITVGGVARRYLLHVPGSLPHGQPAPLVLVFHGGGGHARNMPNFTHFDSLADEQGFIVAYPDSFNRSWNDTRGLSPADDVGFVRALIAELQRSTGIDPKRVYATGISAGGFFSQRLACDLADKIAAVASVAATMPESLVPVCKPSQPISVMFMNGTKDPLVHIEGGPVLRDRGVAIALAAAAKFWRDLDQTTPQAMTEDLPDHANDGTTVHREEFDGGKQGTQVVVYTIVGGGHTWPGGSQYLPGFLIGKVSHNLDATREIWKFFQKHSLQ